MARSKASTTIVTTRSAPPTTTATPTRVATAAQPASPGPLASPKPPGPPASGAQQQAPFFARFHWLIVCVLCMLVVALALTSLANDSPTFDEPFHLAAGVSGLRMGDYRLSPDHPPLGRMWAAWPLLLMDFEWPAGDAPGWRLADSVQFSREWLFELNDGQRLIQVGRVMMVILLVATCLATYGLGRALFGPGAGLLALVLAALSPTLLAHGRLITTDLPATLTGTLTLLTFARLLRRMSWGRLGAAGLAIAAASVTKFSWPLLLPALLVMTVLVCGGWGPMEVPVAQARKASDAAPGRWREARSRGERFKLVLGAGVFVGLAVWVGIWTCYGWRSSMVAPLPPGADTPDAQAQLDETVELLQADWLRALHNPDSTPRTGPVAWFVQKAAETEFLPEGYIFGLARTMQFTSARLAYLNGAYSDEGWRSYFPIAFAIKTPVATQVLILAGLLALVLRKVRSRDGVLLIGLLTFVAVFTLFVINGRVNIGHRHLLPIYPALFALAGGAVAWGATRGGRMVLGAALVWLLAGNLYVHPHYLAYFNELVGGPANGYRHLADSNVDWGQDLLRLRDYARQHPDETIRLAYFGSAIPTRYLDCCALPSYFGFEQPCELGPGTFVVSATQLLGVYDVEMRDGFWDEEHRAQYAQLVQWAKQRPSGLSPEAQWQVETGLQELPLLQQKRLVNRLKHRSPDERIGYSMFVYRLSAADVDELTRP